MNALAMTVRIAWPSILIWAAFAAVWISSRWIPVARALLIQSRIWTILYGVFVVWLCWNDFRANEVIAYFSSTESHAMDQAKLVNGVTVLLDASTAFAPPNSDEIKFEFDDSDSVNLSLTVADRSKQAHCRERVGDFKITVAAPAFTISPPLLQTSQCAITWYFVLAPIHSGLENVDVGLHFAPRGSATPQDRVLRVPLIIRSPRPIWEDQFFLDSLGPVITLIVSLFPGVITWLKKVKAAPGENIC